MGLSYIAGDTQLFHNFIISLLGKKYTPTVHQNHFMNSKHILLLVLALSVSIVSAQRKPRIKGNRSVIEVRQALPSFHSITLLDDLDISLERSSEPGYAIEADDNLIDVLKFEVTSDTLYVSSFYNITAKKKLNIKVFYNNLEAITLKEGQLECKDIISSENLSINTSGMARLIANAKSTFLQLQMDGQSKGEYNLDSDSIQVVLKDRADARIYQASDHLQLNMGDNSDARLEGTTTLMDLDLKFSSNLKAEQMEAATVRATVVHSASAYLRATENLELTSAGSASTYLYGDPKITIHEFRDTCKLYKRTD